MGMHRFSTRGLVLAASLAQGSALAQVAVQSETQNQNESVIADVVVTAQRVSQNAQTVPVTLTALDADALEARQAFNLADTKYLVPNLYLEENLSNPGTPKIFMRGIGQANSAFSFDTPVGIYVDDVYYAKAVGSLVDFIDVDRVEVLRGPQGTIYGRNSSIGAIRVVSKKAPLAGSDIAAEAAVGTHDQRNARIALGLPIVEDKSGFRIAFNSKSNDGYQLNTINGDRANSENSDAVRAQLLTQFNDAVSLTLRGDYLKDDSRPAVALNFRNNSLEDLDFQSNRSYSAGTARSNLETFGGSATLDWTLGDTQLTSITAYRGVDTRNTFDADGTTRSSFEVARSDLDDRSFTQEVFVSGDHEGAAIDWVAGAFFLHETTDYVWSLQVLAPPSVQNFDQKVDSLAGYVQGTYHVTDRLSLTAGARYTEEDKDFDVVSHLADGSFDFSFSDHSLSTQKWTWRAAADYKFEWPMMAYASAATGFRSGGLNGNATSLADVTAGAFGPEDTLMYEAGIKSDFMSGRLRLNAAYFYGEYDDLQQAVVRDDGTVSNTNNSAKVNGLEFEARVLPLSGLELSASVGTLNNKIDNSSRHLAVAPDLTWTVAALYSRPIGVLGTASVGASYSWSDSVFQDTQNSPVLQVPSHGNVDAHLSLVTPGDRWRFTLTGYNLTDKVYPLGGFFIANGFIAASEWPSLPRRWMFAVQYRQ